MSFSFAPAVREQVTILVALAGASGSGKTYSALRLAEGMAPSGKIAFIDTEARRGLHYAEEFKFLHTDMRPPFRPARFIEAIQAAEKAGAEVVIIDSFSHEYDGEDGIMDWADKLAESGTKSPGNWKEPKLAHKKMMNALLQCRASIIFCLRADEKIEIVRENNRTVVRPLGWMPICEKRFMFEMTASFTLVPSQPGIPQFDLPHKVQRQHRGFFREGQPISQESGQLLSAWARGENPKPTGSSAGTPTARPASSATTPQDDAGQSIDSDVARLFHEHVRARIDGAVDHVDLLSWWNSDAQKTQRASLLTDAERAAYQIQVIAKRAELQKAPAQ